MSVRNARRFPIALAAGSILGLAAADASADGMNTVLTPAAIGEVASTPGTGVAAMNAAGRSAGQMVNAAGAYHAYGPGGADLGTLGGGYSNAFGINSAGTVVGESSLADGVTKHAFSSSNGYMSDLGTLPGGTNSYANAVNDAGAAVGGSDNGQGATHAVRFVAGQAGAVDLGTLGGPNSNAVGINNAGQVVGWSGTASGDTHAFSAFGTTLTDLGTLGGSYSAAHGINDAGQIVGESTTAAGPTHGFLYANGAMTDLGTAGGFSSSAAEAINNAGVVVGKLYGLLDPTTNQFIQHAFVYSNGIMTDLNTLLPANSGWTLLDATGITNGDVIYGSGRFNGQLEGYSLTFTPAAVPEPSTLAVFALAGAAFVAVRSMRRRTR